MIWSWATFSSGITYGLGAWVGWQICNLVRAGWRLTGRNLK